MINKLQSSKASYLEKHCPFDKMIIVVLLMNFLALFGWPFELQKLALKILKSDRGQKVRQNLDATVSVNFITVKLKRYQVEFFDQGLNQQLLTSETLLRKETTLIFGTDC